MSAGLHRPPGMKIHGLTGGIASGKTQAGRYFAELGVPVIDADELARELRAPGGAAHDAILAAFGTVDARELRGIIFSDPAKKAQLEAILHPLIQVESERRFREFSKAENGTPPKYCLYEAALLVETGRHRSLDGLIVIVSDPETQLRRLMKRDGVEEAAARQTLVSQGDQTAKREAATHLIVNDGTLDELRAQVGEIHSLLAS